MSRVLHLPSNFNIFIMYNLKSYFQKIIKQIIEFLLHMFNVFFVAKCEWTMVKKKILSYSHGQELFYKFISNFTNKLVKQLLSMTVYGLRLQ